MCQSLTLQLDLEICCHKRITAGKGSVALTPMSAAKLSLTAASCNERNDALRSSAEVMYEDARGTVLDKERRIATDACKHCKLEVHVHSLHKLNSYLTVNTVCSYKKIAG